MRRIAFFVLIILLVFAVSSIVVSGSFTQQVPEQFESLSGNYSITSNPVENPGFESGQFSPWINTGAVTTNSIQSSVVYSGTYALQLDSIYSSYPFNPVVQSITAPKPVTTYLGLTATIYPTDTGVTCGAYGRAYLQILIEDTNTSTTKRMSYLWSGYDYPGSDSNVNVSYAYFLYYDWTPNQWHIIERNILEDWTSVWGSPTNPSDLRVIEIALCNHASNGEPGTFYADDLYIDEIDPDSGWLDGWSHRKGHVVRGAEDAGCDYQISYRVNYGTGTDIDENVYCDTNCQSDFRDIRFTNYNSTIVYDYWIEEFTPLEYAIFWVKIADNLTLDVAMWVYYGNTTVSSQSNGTETFIFFDDFEDGIIDPDRWSEYNMDVGASFSEGSSNLNVTDTSVEDDGWERMRGLFCQSGGGDWNPPEHSFKVSLLGLHYDCGSVNARQAQFGLSMSDVKGTTQSCNSEIFMAFHDEWTSHPGSYRSGVDDKERAVYADWLDYSGTEDLFICKDPDNYVSTYYGSTRLLHAHQNQQLNYIYIVYNGHSNGNYPTLELDTFIFQKWVRNGPAHSIWSPSPLTYDSSPPRLSQIDDITFESSSSIYIVNWTSYDTNPSYYDFFIDESIDENSVWDGSDITYSLEGWTPGFYNLTMAVYDENSNSAIDSVYINVTDFTAPEISSPLDIHYLVGSTGNEISWTPTDLYPDKYQISRNNVTLEQGSWSTSGQVFSVVVDDLSEGTYQYVLKVTDTSGNSAEDVVVVSVSLTTTSTTITTTTSTTPGTSATTLVTTPMPPIDSSLQFIIVLTGGSVGIILIIGVLIIRREGSTVSRDFRYG